jgi:ABC-type glycerol-3-phosphate transport system substrate-binding protein
VESAATPTNSSTKTVITFGSLAQNRALVEPWITAFNAANPDLQVQFVSLNDLLTLSFRPTNGVLDREEIIRKTAEAADTFGLMFVGTPTQQRRYYQNLLPFIERDSRFQRDDYPPSALPIDTTDGSLRFLPTRTLVPTLSYNKELFAKRGVMEPTATWTWRDVREAALQLTQQDDPANPIYGFVGGSGWIGVAGELTVADPEWRTRSTGDGVLNLDTPAYRTALEQTAQLVQTGALYLPPPENTNMDITRNLVYNGQAAMWLTADAFGDGEPLPFAHGTLPLPEIPVQLEPAPDFLFAMSAGTQHPEAAWRWLSFFSQQVYVDWQGVEGANLGVPVLARTSQRTQAEFVQRIGPEVAEAAEIMLARPMLPPNDAQRVAPYLSMALFELVYNTQSPSQALGTAQAIMQEEEQRTQREARPNAPVLPIVVAPPPLVNVPAGATRIRFRPAPVGGATTTETLVHQFNQQQQAVFVELPTADIGMWSLQQQAADVDCFAWSGTISAGDERYVRDLQPLLDADASFPRDDYPPALLADMQQDGRLLALPHRFDTAMLRYNQNQLQAEGLARPTGAWRIADLLVIAQQLTNQQAATPQYGFAVQGDLRAAVPLLLQIDRVEAVQQAGQTFKPRFTDPATLTAVQTIVELLRTTSPHNRLLDDRSMLDAPSLISAGQVGVWLETESTPTLFVQEPAQPSLPLPNNTNVRINLALYVNAQSPHAEACWQWFRYLNSQPQGLGVGWPVPRSLAQAVLYQPQASGGQQTVYDALQPVLNQASGAQVLPWWRHPAFEPFWFYRAVDRAVQGGDLERELQEAQTLTEAHLACVQGGGQPGPCARQVDSTYEGFSQ